VRLYLSSFRLGDHPERLVAMVPEPRRIAVICNAIDNEPDERPGKVAAEIGWLRDLGLDPTEVDLRTDDPAGLAAYQAVWVRGGNVFVLREAMRRGGADEILTDLIRTDKIVYAGYSAGPCVLAPSLRGLELCDDITAVVEPIWTGLGVLDQPSSRTSTRPCTPRPNSSPASRTSTTAPTPPTSPSATARP
jgi:dipeptidase E